MNHQNHHVVDRHFYTAAVEFCQMRNMRQIILVSLDEALLLPDADQDGIEHMRTRVNAMIKSQCRAITKKLTKTLIRIRGSDFHTADCCFHKPSPVNPRIEEHCVPVGMIHKRVIGLLTYLEEPELLAVGPLSAFFFIKENFIIADVTVEQNKTLLPANGMPPGWDWLNPNKMLRYEQANPLVAYFPLGGCEHCNHLGGLL